MFIELGSSRYRVRRVKNVLAEVKKIRPEESEELLGFLDRGTQTIFVEASGDPRKEAEILYHEMQHHIHHSDDGEKEEIMVCYGTDALFPALWKQGWRPFGE